MSLLELTDRSKREGTGEAPDASDRLAHRTRLFEQMAFLGCATLALLSVFHFTMEMYALAVLQFPILFINIINLVSQRYHRRLELAMNVMLGTMFIVLLGTAMIGGVVNSGILWLPLYPILVFLLLGKGAGIYWVITYNIAIFSLFIAELNGFNATPFEADFVIYVFISTMVMSSLVYIYENQREKLVDELELERIRAEEASRTKSEFLANMSHEIRTPMNGIIGLTSIILEGNLSKENRHYAELLQSSSETLMGLINDVLDISKIEANKVDIAYQSVDLAKLINALMSLLKPGADAKEIGLETHLNDELPKSLMLDPLRLRQIVLNIVGNAIKFTHEGEIRLTVDIQDG
ncbi:MAG: hypothetical protein GQ470_04300, partial [Gammaproteobacteria bacterium]|nr:hypothetical protein [Gammaproteobacteria bacterium]